MNSRQLQLFLAIAEQGSFSKAEKTEYISKQALLRQVNQLEDEVGEKLLLRTPYGISLTEAGRFFCDGAKEILDLEDDVLERCRKSMSLQEELRVSYVEHQALLNDVTEAFMQKYPDIRIRRVVHPNHSGEYRVEHGIADVGETFYSKHTASSPNAYTRLADMFYLAAMSHNHPLAEKTQVTLEDLTNYPVMIYAPMMDAGYRQELQRIFAAKGRPVRKDSNASFLAGYPCLDIRNDVDAQVQAAFFVWKPMQFCSRRTASFARYRSFGLSLWLGTGTKNMASFIARIHPEPCKNILIWRSHGMRHTDRDSLRGQQGFGFHPSEMKILQSSVTYSTENEQIFHTYFRRASRRLPSPVIE